MERTPAHQVPALLLQRDTSGLAAIRKDKGLTQQALADRVGVHFTQIRRYEADNSAPTLDVLRELARALSVSADALVFDPDERVPSDDLRLIFEAASLLDDDGKQLVKGVVEGVLLRHEAHRWTNVSWRLLVVLSFDVQVEVDATLDLRKKRHPAVADQYSVARGLVVRHVLHDAKDRRTPFQGQEPELGLQRQHAPIELIEMVLHHDGGRQAGFQQPSVLGSGHEKWTHRNRLTATTYLIASMTQSSAEVSS